MFGDPSNKLNCRSEEQFNSNHQCQGRENSTPFASSSGTFLYPRKQHTIITAARTTSWDTSAPFGPLISLSSCITKSSDDATCNKIQFSGSHPAPQLVTNSVTQAPLQALLTAPTKFKPESSRQCNGSARFASKR